MPVDHSLFGIVRHPSGARRMSLLGALRNPIGVLVGADHRARNRQPQPFEFLEYQLSALRSRSPFQISNLPMETGYWHSECILLLRAESDSALRIRCLFENNMKLGPHLPLELGSVLEVPAMQPSAEFRSALQDGLRIGSHIAIGSPCRCKPLQCNPRIIGNRIKT